MTALEKARAALAAIANDDSTNGDFDGSNARHVDLLALARTQAEIAQGEALGSIAESLRILAYRND